MQKQTDRLQTRMVAADRLLNAQEAWREWRGFFGRSLRKFTARQRPALKRALRLTAPELALRAGVKKPETGSGFWNWWWGGSLRQTTVESTQNRRFGKSPTVVGYCRAG
ncbi:hypothetical protein [Sulfurivermis fontis]|uniref:hypothetical protein n=1 Tax=Sulfurivermis fontis TaxID=1972068 RepID=UPI000FDBA570|nr:hypothetical protein [Sulfurivermis fontis]